jgi:rabenosyn-5
MTPLATTSSTAVASEVGPVASSSSSSSPTPIRTRKTSTFRHVPARATQTPIVPSPLSPVKGHSRAASLSSHILDLNKPHRPHSRLSTVSLLGNSSQAPLSHDVSVGKTTTINQHQKDIGQSDWRSATETVVHPSPTVLRPVPVQKTPSSSPSQTPAASASPVTSPSPSSTHTGTPVRPPAPYRPGFQPKGVYRPLTDEFLEFRRSRRDIGRVEQTRLERRLEKLINLHFGEDTDKRPTPRPKQAKRMSSIWELDIRSMGPSDLWRGVVQSQAAAGGKADIRGEFPHL